ncbi:MAG: ATP-binding protein [Deltaproteobacteria bacterium]|nr:ATP-binding protein [Deltaproteobacteria bacterium]MBN2672802.1 ATP-binding protein [Deltaproteobacteria bacterium]
MNDSRGGIPAWAEAFSDAHAGGIRQLFIFHGNVGDLIPYQTGDEVKYSLLSEFLASQMFGTFDTTLYYDQVRGPRALADNPKRLSAMNQHIERFIGKVEELRNTTQVAKVFAVLDRYLERLLLSEGEISSTALIFDYAHFMLPSSGVSTTARELAPTLATVLNWAKSPYFKKAPFAFCLISERLSDLHESVTRNAHVTNIEIPFPSKEDRLRFIQWITAGLSFSDICELDAAALAEFTRGLTLIHLQGMLKRAIRSKRKLRMADLKAYKKQMIEDECQGLVEIIEPNHTLQMVVGQQAAKQRLIEDGDLIRDGHLEAAPMGYLICGPVGTGKSFLAECYAGSIGMPCVKLLNFRSKYVGETEGNLEKILKVLRVMGPVAVIIDEADAVMGDRRGGTDSGTSSRIFSQFATQMGNTQYRGSVVWFLLTCRPDLLPIDIKRQGRCEVHIPLFYPESEEDFAEMFVVMGKKNGVDITTSNLPSFSKSLELSGADIEGIVTRARRLALIDGSDVVEREHLQKSLDDFIPSHQSDEKELQVTAAVLESTDIGFLPETYQKQVRDENGRKALAERFSLLSSMI